MNNTPIHILDTHFQDFEMAIGAFAIPTADGLVLVETGPYSVFSHIEQGLNKIGFSTDDVKHVLLTHIHLDHAGAAWAFAEKGATVYVHPKGYEHLKDPSKLMRSATRIYGDKMDTLWGAMKEIPESQLQTVSHGEVLALGDLNITAWHTPGHAIHHTAWQLGEALFTGDVAGVKIKNGPVEPPCPPPDINLEDWKSSLALIRKINPARLYLTHFGVINQVEEHLDELEHYLDAWANWMLPKYQAQESPENITPMFQEFVKEQFKAARIDMDLLAIYEVANPSWMSVAGLLRYWHKKLHPS